MVPELRERFNAGFTEERYRRFLQSLESAVGVEIKIRPCETPVFLPNGLLAEMERAAEEIMAQLSGPDYLESSARAIPRGFNAPNEGVHPHFVQIDFAIVGDEDGELSPKLIELQGCASVYALQLLLSRTYREVYGLGDLDYLLGGLSEEGYLDLLRRVILNGHPPEQVILMEIDPRQQKTLPDFLMTEKLLGLPTVAVTDIMRRGKKLFYRLHGREIEIRRLYNRVIIDEFVKKGVRAAFDFSDDLDVEWAGHPNWYFRLSKFSLPFLDHKAVPRAYFLDHLAGYPNDLENFVLKPLFSFAGSGVKIDLTAEDLESIPPDKRSDYLLQEKVRYAPVIETPGDPSNPSKVELRLMYLWPEDLDRPIAVTTLARLSKSSMMGVDFNKSGLWIGSSCGMYSTCMDLP